MGSPISLEALLAGGSVEGTMSEKSWTVSNENERKLKSKPLLVRKLPVVFKMKEALLPLLNSKLHYYSIPHVFRFEMYQGVCVMQYKMFSSQKDFLPHRPESFAGTYDTYLHIIGMPS